MGEPTCPAHPPSQQRIIWSKMPVVLKLKNPELNYIEIEFMSLEKSKTSVSNIVGS